MNKTPHYWAVLLTHERIEYGQILEEQPELLDALKKAIFKAAKGVLEEAVGAHQAEIDRLMLEYCPEEMAPAQIEEWRKHQVRASLEQEAALYNATSTTVREP